MSQNELLKQEEVQALVAAMIELYPQLETELNYNSHFQLLVAVVLSAQATDAGVNKVTPELFDLYPTPEAMSQAPLEDLERIIQPIGLSKNKSKYIKKLSEQLVEKFDGQVPADRKSLESLSGVGRKTGSVVLTNAFDIPAFAVDTHIERICKRYLMVDPEASVRQVEDQMCQHLPEDTWAQAHHSILLFGRYQCVARKHDHESCLERLAPIANKTKPGQLAMEKLYQKV